MYEEATENDRERVVTVVTTAEELDEVLDKPASYRLAGPVVVPPASLRGMQHIGLAATVVFNPFGPTVETLSLASFDGAWGEGRAVLLRRKLHPFSEPYIQIVTEVYVGTETWRDHLGAVLVTYIGGNGASAASREWAEPLHATVPSGIVITGIGREWELESGQRRVSRGAGAALQSGETGSGSRTSHRDGGDF